MACGVLYPISMKRLLLTCAILALSVASACAQTDKDHNFDVVKNLSVFNEIYKQLDLLYVDTLNANEVVGGAINAMLQRLDPYTEYYPADKTGDFLELITGKFAGIGAMIRYNQKLRNTVIEEPYEGMPAAEVGLKRGDIILSINDESMEKKDTRYVSNRLRGDAGSTFSLKVKRPSTGKTLSFNIKRRLIKNPAVPYYGMREQGVGYIKLTGFTEDCTKEVRRAFIDLKGQGMQSLILDLRSNGGGSEMEAVNLVNMFIPKGLLVVANKGKQKRGNREYKTTVEPIDSVMPVIVLVNEGTASSAEITAGALQDFDRAVILGSRTFGKGLVQISTDLPYNGKMKITTSKYFIPSGRCIQAIDYRKRRGGYVDHLPDSLTKVFYTRNGREVRDGGGIKPDVELRPDSLANIAYYLSVYDSTEVMHDYIIDYVASHPKIAPPAEFELSDADYEQFKQRVMKSGFVYDRETEKLLKSLIKLARFEGYYDDAKEEFDNLEKKLTHNLSKELDFHKELLKRIITSEIVTAYYFQKGAIENSFKHDKQIKEAIRLLQFPEEYKAILAPVKR